MKAKLKAIDDERREKLKGTLSDEQINKLDALTQEMMKMRGKRQG